MFAAVLLAAAAKSVAFVWLGRRLRSHQDWHAKGRINAVSWLAGPCVSLLMLPLSALLGAGLGEDVITTMIPEMGVAATISLVMR